MKGFAILILIVAFFWLLGPAIMRWLKRKAMERTEDYLRQSMGMPPREKKKKGRDKRQQEDQDSYYYRTHQRAGNPYYRKGPVIPSEYAEDVEYIETIDYSGKEYTERIHRHIEIHYERQVSDAEWTEIKKPRTK